MPSRYEVERAIREILQDWVQGQKDGTSRTISSMLYDGLRERKMLVEGIE